MTLVERLEAWFSSPETMLVVALGAVLLASTVVFSYLGCRQCANLAGLLGSMIAFFGVYRYTRLTSPVRGDE